jgi:hypothetical protein
MKNKVETDGSPKTSVKIYPTLRLHSPRGSKPDFHSRENLKCRESGNVYCNFDCLPQIFPKCNIYNFHPSLPFI